MGRDELHLLREVGAALRARPTGDAPLDDVLRRSRRLRRRRRAHAGLAVCLPLVLVAATWGVVATHHRLGRARDAITLASGPTPDLASPPAPPAVAGRTIGSMVAGGNVVLQDDEASWIAKFQTLNAIGASVARVIVWPPTRGRAEPAPARLDRMMQLAHDHQITPILLLQLPDGPDGNPSLDPGGYNTWVELGREYAGRFAPGGAFQQEHGITGEWGVSLYQTITRPDARATLPVADYVAALEGLADGVHEVDPDLAVVAGGLRPSGRDPTLAGYGPALAPLLNAGTLDGLDLHSYYDAVRAPIEGGYEHSAQDNFDEVKRASGITADIGHYASNWNYRRDSTSIEEGQAARGVLTAFWDTLGVVGADGSTGVSRFAMPWNLFRTEAEDPAYGMAAQLDPWVPNDSGRALRTALEVAADLHFVSLDPRGSGEYVLEGAGKKLWVWQNREGWTAHPGTAFTVTGLPAGAGELEVYGWEGIRRTIPLHGQRSLVVTDLPTEETLMFLVRPAAQPRALRAAPVATLGHHAPVRVRCAAACTGRCQTHGKWRATAGTVS